MAMRGFRASRFAEKDDMPHGTTLTSRLSNAVLAMTNYEIPQNLKFEAARRLYQRDPVVRSFIETYCSYVLKDDFYIDGGDESSRKIIEDYFANVNWQQIMMKWLRESKVFGIGYLEITNTNLFNRPACTMHAKVDPKTGEVTEWIQKPNTNDNKTWTKFDVGQIATLPNGGFADTYYGISDVATVDYVIKFLKDPAERDLIVTLNKYAGDRYKIKVGSEFRPVSKERYQRVVDYFSELKTGEDVIFRGDIEVNMLTPQYAAIDFRTYLDYILNILSIGLGVPLVFWVGQGATEATAKIQLEAFEANVKATRSLMEWAINEQVIPKIVPGTKYPKFKFKPINLNEEFLAAQIEQIKHSVTPAENADRQIKKIEKLDEVGNLDE